MRIDYQFYAERKKLPPCASQLIIGGTAFIVANNGKGLISGALPLPEGFWSLKSKDGSQ